MATQNTTSKLKSANHEAVIKKQRRALRQKEEQEKAKKLVSSTTSDAECQQWWEQAMKEERDMERGESLCTIKDGNKHYIENERGEWTEK